MTEARWGRIQVPLAHPYQLSFTRLTALDVVWVWLAFDAGPPGVGEAVALPGYGDETADEIAAALSEVPQLVGQRAAELDLGAGPFARSALRTAVQLPRTLDTVAQAFDSMPSVALNTALAPRGKRTLEAAQRMTERGFRYLKVKVGADLKADLDAARRLLAPTAPDARYVFDANQGYDVGAALTFAQMLADDPCGRVQWFEQPVDRDDWAAMAEVCRQPVPVLLDEPIHDAEGVRRAADIGATGVKLKLCKVGGPQDLARLARGAGELRVVQGNGVATDLGNLPELLLAMLLGERLEAPCEASGFVRLERPLLFDLTVGAGHARVPAHDEIVAALETAPARLEATR